MTTELLQPIRFTRTYFGSQHIEELVQSKVSAIDIKTVSRTSGMPGVS